MPIFVTIVLDGVGIGAQPDADLFGDVGADTLGHICQATSPRLDNLARLGLGAIKPLAGIPSADRPEADFGMMTEVSAGKDSTTGHWELAGIILDRAFPTYPNGFPETLILSFLEVSGFGGVLGNEAASGTEIIARLGDEHRETGYPIVYTSADSVFQVAAHVDTVPLDQLYDVCRLARDEVLIGDHAVGRVIARPFTGDSSHYQRISEERKDFSLLPPQSPIQEVLRNAQVRTIAVGKIGDLFAGIGFDDVRKTRSNAEGVRSTLEAIQEAARSNKPTFIWTNLVDFDQEYGHRNDVEGFARALEEFDAAIPAFESALPEDSVLVITADHGNDPAFPGTDHCREYVPLLVRYDGSGSDIGVRTTFADHAASAADYYKVETTLAGTSFLSR
ncbi:MAG: phosphopentomutase [Rhodothermia bacterium]|nr:phosphopentomutase [Rhodothermia bacterium]